MYLQDEVLNSYFKLNKEAFYRVEVRLFVVNFAGLLAFSDHRVDKQNVHI